MNEQQPAGEATYDQRYYDTHKEELADKRKQKYAEDPEHRQACIDRAKKYYEENREEIRKKSRRIPWAVWPGDGGKEEEVYQISALCLALGKKPLTVRLWIREGKIPDTPLRRNRIRYYTQAMISLAAASVPDTFRKDWEAVHSEIERAWEALGVYDEGVLVVSK